MSFSQYDVITSSEFLSEKKNIENRLDYIQELIVNHLNEVNAEVNLGTITRSWGYSSELTTCNITVSSGLKNFKGTAIVTLSGSSNTLTSKSVPTGTKVTAKSIYKNNGFLNTLTATIYTNNKYGLSSGGVTVSAFPSRTFQLKICDAVGKVYDNIIFSNLVYIGASGSGALNCEYCSGSCNLGSDEGYEYYTSTAYSILPSDISSTISALSLSGDQVTIYPGSSVSGGSYSASPSVGGTISFTFSVDFVRSVT